MLPKLNKIIRMQVQTQLQKTLKMYTLPSISIYFWMQVDNLECQLSRQAQAADNLCRVQLDVQGGS